jgi:phage terminase large subunit GpA-like protein
MFRHLTNVVWWIYQRHIPILTVVHNSGYKAFFCDFRSFRKKIFDFSHIENIIFFFGKYKQFFTLCFIHMLAIDTGFATQDVYAWCRKQEAGRVLAVKGVERAIAPVGVSLLKSELYQWLKLQRGEDGLFPAGYCHFPQYEAEYFKQLTAEQLVTKTVKGYPKREWQKLRERNEALDCRIYARAAAITLGIERFADRHWQNLEAQLIPAERRTIDPVTPTKPLRPRVTRSRSRWMS